MKKKLCLLVALLLCATILPLYSSADIVLDPIDIIDAYNKQQVEAAETALGLATFSININGTKSEKEAALGVLVEPIATELSVNYTVTVTSENIYEETIAFDVYVSLGKRNATVHLTATQTGELITLSGVIKSRNQNNKITVELKQEGETVYSTEIAPIDGYIPSSSDDFGEKTAEFSIEGIANGTYDLVVTKVCHITYTIKNIVVSGENIDLTQSEKDYSVISLRAGDVDGNGSINPQDVVTIRYPSNINKKIENAEYITADVNGDGRVNPLDVQVVREEYNMNKGIINSTYDY